MFYNEPDNANTFPPSLQYLEHHLTYGFFGHTWATHQNSISIYSAVFAGIRNINSHTDTHYSICSNRPHRIHFSFIHTQWIGIRLAGWLFGRLMPPFSTKNRLYRGRGLGYKFSSARLRVANDTVTSQSRCLFCSAMTQNEQDRGGSFMLLC